MCDKNIVCRQLCTAYVFENGVSQLPRRIYNNKQKKEEYNT
jgi:hypothetical protein